MPITLYGKITQSEKLTKTKYVYTVENKYSSIYLLSDLDISIGSMVRVSGILDNFTYNSIVCFCIVADKITILRFLTENEILIPITCTLDYLTKIADDRYIAKYKIIDEYDNAYNVLYITSIITTKHIIDELLKVKLQSECSVTIKPMIDKTLHNKRKYDMMCKTIGIKKENR